jgi:ADP-heptose:LPS heptosyltransferase
LETIKMPNAKNTGRLKRLLFSLLGSSRGKDFLARKVRKQTGGIPPFSFPIDIASVKKILIILPSEPLDVLYQLNNVLEMAAHFKNAKLTLLAEESCVPFARMMEGAEVVEYRQENKQLFSSTFNGFNRDFSGTADLCCLLTREEDPPLLYLTGRTAAPIRAGYVDAGGSPFINLHIGPSADRHYLPEWNCAMAEILGARKMKPYRSTVAKATIGEIDQLLREQGLDPAAKLIGIDAPFFSRNFGAKWTAGLIEALTPLLAETSVYLYTQDTGSPAEREKLARYGLPIIGGLTVPQTVALASRSKVVITGNTLLFGLATLIGGQALGVFKLEEHEAYCLPPPAPQVGITYEKNPTGETIEAVAGAIGKLLKTA